MKIKIFDEAHEKDLEDSLNKFITSVKEIYDIKFQTAIYVNGEDQIYCFTALIMYD